MTLTSRSPKPRLIDVAARAGVSMKTVSNVINGYPYVSDRTRARVEQAVEEVGYRPNLSARNLARGRSGMVALVVPQLEMPYFASLAGELIRAAESRGWFMLIEQTHGDVTAERAALEASFPQRIDGLIISSLHLDSKAIHARKDTTPLVMLGDRELGEGVLQVSIDNFGAGREVARHLAAVGRHRNAVIGASCLSSDPRVEGFQEGLRGAGLGLPSEMVRAVSTNSGDEGERATREMLEDLEEPPDGLFAATDWIAMGAIRALHQHGLRVPRDVAVVGFDDIPYARDMSPSLTTVSTDRRRIAEITIALIEQQIGQTMMPDIETKQAVDRLSRQGIDQRTESALHRVPFELVVRESSNCGRLTD